MICKIQTADPRRDLGVLWQRYGYENRHRRTALGVVGEVSALLSKSQRNQQRIGQSKMEAVGACQHDECLLFCNATATSSAQSELGLVCLQRKDSSWQIWRLHVQSGRDAL